MKVISAWFTQRLAFAVVPVLVLIIWRLFDHDNRAHALAATVLILGCNAVPLGIRRVRKAVPTPVTPSSPADLPPEIPQTAAEHTQRLVPPESPGLDRPVVVEEPWRPPTYTRVAAEAAYRMNAAKHRSSSFPRRTAAAAAPARTPAARQG